MSSGKIIEFYHINNYVYSYPIDLNLSLGHQVVKSQRVDAKLEKTMNKIYRIHWLLKINSQLSNTLKLDYCKIERALMIEYLKNFIKKV